jgi:hypothetical protein
MPWAAAATKPHLKNYQGRRTIILRFFLFGDFYREFAAKN